MKTEEEELIPVGTVAGTHGLRGDLKIRLLSGDPSPLLEAGQIFLRNARGEISSHAPERRSVHKKHILLRFSGLTGIEAAAELVGCDVLIRLADLPELAEEEYYWFELEGLTVADRSRGELGTLDDFFPTAAHDIYVVNGPFGEILIPAIEGFIVEIDLAGRQMVVDLPEGLVPESDEL
jgi:16S rRNA processing protein RimM